MQGEAYFLSLVPKRNTGQHVHLPYLPAKKSQERLLTCSAALTGLLHKSKYLIPVKTFCKWCNCNHIFEEIGLILLQREQHHLSS